MPFWSVAQTESQREHVAAQFLKQADFEIYLPKIQVRHGSRERVAPLFPGYLFVEINAGQWSSVRWTIGVLNLLTTNGEPARVAGSVMEAIRQREGDNGLIKLPKPRGLARGDRVRVLRGSFEGRLGIYHGLSGAQRCRILLELLGREVPVVMQTRDVVREVTASCNL